MNSIKLNQNDANKPKRYNVKCTCLKPQSGVEPFYHFSEAIAENDKDMLSIIAYWNHKGKDIYTYELMDEAVLLTKQECKQLETYEGGTPRLKYLKKEIY